MHSLSVLRPAVWALVLGGTLSAAPVQWTAASGGNDNWYDLVPASIFSGISFDSARSAALASTFNSLSGYLATITSEAEYLFILNNFGTSIPVGFGATGSVWLGGSDVATPNTFRWVDGPEAGQAFTYASWAPGHPNFAAGDYVGLFRNAATFGTNSYGFFVTSGTVGYIVEYGDGIVDAQQSAVPEPSSAALAGCGLAAFMTWRRRNAKH